jgi:predicted transcriptional regulator
VSERESAAPAAPGAARDRGSPGFVRGLQLAEMRRAAGVTQAALARAMGISQARISKIEHGEVAGIDVVGAYVGALGGRMEILARFEDRVWTVA